jgi:lipopolysaccharide/colanic/teichoic acid biosynthesis glycosyltransferase
VKLEDGGPAIFKQERIGKGGKPFNIYKFRSLTIDKERDENALFGHERSADMTKTGRFLRDHHLD